MSEKFNILDLINHTEGSKKTNRRIIAEILHKNKNKWLNKRNIEKEFSLRKAFGRVQFPITAESAEDLINISDLIPEMFKEI